MRKTAIFIVLALLLSLCVAPVYASDIPPLPHAFYGDVTINGNPAPTRTTVEARCDGVVTGTYNPITITDPGEYGSADPLGAKLIVQGEIAKGATIEFYVNGHVATTDPATVNWHSGETTQVGLSVTIRVGGGGGGFVGGVSTGKASLFGTTGSFKISSDGEIQETIEATSEDGTLTITIEEGTIVLGEDGKRLRTLEAIIDENPPDPPEGANIIGLAYDFEPDGATFNPAITLEYTYDPEDIPEGVAEEDLVLAFYDEDAGEWIELTCTVDTANNTITAYIDHFTTFAIIGTVTPAPTPAPAAFTLPLADISPAEVAPGEEVTITVSVANTGGTEGSYSVVLKINDAKEAEKDVTVTAGESQEVGFTVTREKPGDYAVMVGGLGGSFTVAAPAPAPAPASPPAPAEEVVPVNWPVIGGAIGGVIVIGLLVFFLVRRRAY